MDISQYLKDEYETVTYPLQGGATVDIRMLSPQRYDEIRKECRRTIKDGVSITEEVDESEQAKKLLAETVKGWTKLEDEDGPMEYTRDNVIRVYYHWWQFRNVFNSVIYGGMGMQVEAEEAISGN